MMNQTNYTSISTCSCIGENFAITLPIENGRVRVPMLSTADVDARVGGDSSFEQRRAFEWGMLGVISRRNGEEQDAAYCFCRVQELKGVAS